jgi:hypothetical protein
MARIAMVSIDWRPPLNRLRRIHDGQAVAERSGKGSRGADWMLRPGCPATLQPNWRA